MLIATATLLTSTAGAAAAGHVEAEPLYTPPPNRGAVTQIRELIEDRRWRDAWLIRKLIETPSAVWFNGGGPNEVRREVARVVRRAQRSGTLPVLVAYNLPFRDCAQYSASGALGLDEYEVWIDGFAKGIGTRDAIVILEPDGPGIIPFNIDLNGNAEWCQPVDEHGSPQPGATPGGCSACMVASALARRSRASPRCNQESLKSTR